MDYTKEFVEYFTPLCRRYGLQLLKIASKDMAVVGERFVLFLLQDFREQEICPFYACLNKNGEVENWRLTVYIREKLMDRGVYDGYGPGRRPSIREIIPKLAELLEEEFSDLLQGGTAWMEAYFKNGYPYQRGLSIEERPFANEYLLGR